MLSHPRTIARAALIMALVAVLVASAVLATSPAHAQRIKPDFWGMHDKDWTTRPTVPVGSANLTTSGTYWKDIEKTPGVYSWGRLDAQVAAAEAKHAQPMIVLGFTPTFHSSTPTDSADPKTHVPLAPAWLNYVTAVAAKYGTDLDYQIWPEPNIVENWNGTPAEMANLTMLASNAIKSQPGAANARVVSPAMALRLNGQRQWMVKYFEQSVGGERVHTYVDAVAIDPFPQPKGTPEDSFQLMQTARRLLAGIGVRKPFWNNEINYGVAGGHDETGVSYTDAQARSLVIRTYALSAAARMQRTYWLGWFRTSTMGVQMTDTAGNKAAAGRAYDVVHSWMSGTSFQGCRQATRGKTKGLWTCTMRKSRTELRRIYWKTGPPVKIRVHRTTRAWENQNGVRTRRRGAFRLRITSQPVMVVSRR